MIEVGQKVRFDPFKDMRIPVFRGDYSRMVIGTVVYVNRRRGWFMAEYTAPGGKVRTSFKFSQLGTDVNLVRK